MLHYVARLLRKRPENENAPKNENDTKNEDDLKMKTDKNERQP